MNRTLLFAAVALGAVAAQSASASSVTNLTADYFSVSVSGNNSTGDFYTSQPSTYGTYTDMVKSALGPNGMPVYNVGYGTPDGPALHTLLPGTAGSQQLAWWTPGNYNSNTVHITQTGNNVAYSVPFSDTSMFPPNGTGSSDSSAFLTAIFSGTINLDATSTVTFNLGADDDAFLFVDGVSLVEIGGIHSDSVAPTTTSPLSAGAHTFELFYADRNKDDAELTFNILTISAVPEPATWAMMLAGFGILGLAMRRRKTAISFA